MVFNISGGSIFHKQITGKTMAIHITPTIGDWYKNIIGEMFEVVAYDQTVGLVEIQYFDGTVEELELDAWYEQEFMAIQPPEVWSGSLDIERQDYGVDLEENYHLDWSNPLDTFEM